MSFIPKIIHQIWVGPHPKPKKLMKTWKSNHPDWEFKSWNEDVRGFRLEKQINQMLQAKNYPGTADLIRYEILHRYGGFVAPADSISLKSIEPLRKLKCFVCYTNELWRPGTISPHIGCCKDDELMDYIIKDLSQRENVNHTDAYKVTGNLLLTYYVYKYPELVTILPSHTFLPEFYTGYKYEGDGEVYANHLWGSTHQINNKLDNYV